MIIHADSTCLCSAPKCGEGTPLKVLFLQSSPWFILKQLDIFFSGIIPQGFQNFCQSYHVKIPILFPRVFWGLFPSPWARNVIRSIFISIIKSPMKILKQNRFHRTSTWNILPFTDNQKHVLFFCSVFREQFSDLWVKYRPYSLIFVENVIPEHDESFKTCFPFFLSIYVG